MAAVLPKTIENDENLETYCLIWLDASVNTSRENFKVQQQLQAIINHLLTFEDDQQCLHYIKNRSEDDRIILIVSGRFGRIIVPQIANLQQITSIYVYCFDKTANELWSRPFAKVKGVIVRLDELIKQIEKDYTQQQHDKIDEPLSIKVFEEKQISIDLHEQFIHAQLLIDCLIRMKSSSNDKSELTDFCQQYYKKNYTQLMIVKEFENNYSSDKALWWYTRHSFVSQLLNKALLTQNIDILFLFRFFIHDIGCQLGKKRCLSPVRVYRSQLMSKENLEMLQSSVGKFISINSFLLANIDSEKTRSSLDFAKPLCDIERVFFVIKANPEIHNTKPFNNIQSYGYFQNPNEILFMVGSIFRIEGIERPADQIWNIRMTLCSINDQELKSLLEHMKKNLGIGKTNLIQFSNILYRMRKLNNAEKYSRRYLNQLPNGHPDIANCYQTFGKIAESKKEFALSLKWYKRSLDIFSKTLKSDDPNIAEIYNNMANVYSKINDYTNAMNSYQKVLEIWKKIAGDKHPYVAQCINNIGAVHEMTKKYSEALDCYRQALKILKNSLSSDHPDIAMTHRNIAYVHELKGEFKDALNSYEKALKIYRHLLPSTQIHVNEIEKTIRRMSHK
ncbi:unnamed protein product [Rotaria sp. Silwood1]|nr:unnamed protein product [Rotaria sp. Silwood1]CAF3456725.1 unnamed protein product [Rotaria sp. Silwood1]CAF3480372.1 unnamed protein product [Rotaria sp. Silwood1]CAF4637237.1 unnamed protein product [Rotaria sp. Silwood1]CAF4810226.1 unnamed protein product [Rotaria sp. Silwood1]